MSARRYDLLVFDWDGTLIDSAPTIVACIQSACRDLGLAVPDDERASHVIGLGLRDALAHAVPGLDPDEYGRVVERYRHHFLQRDPHMALFDGTREMLHGLRDAGHVLAIATGKSRAGLARALESTRLGPLFSASRCAD
ncbi:MAG TPA: HAD hydrolase-like protein, partial [Burkholderiales bacterium]